MDIQKDKIQHFGVSFALTLFLSALMPLCWSGSLTLFIGILWEIAQKAFGFGQFDWSA